MLPQTITQLRIHVDSGGVLGHRARSGAVQAPPPWGGLSEMPDGLSDHSCRRPDAVSVSLGWRALRLHRWAELGPGGLPSDSPLL